MANDEKDAAMAVHAAGEEDAGLKPDMQGDSLQMPESIRNMSEAEIETMKKKMIRKMDAVIM